MPWAMLEINLIQMIQGDLFIQALSLDCCNNDLLPFPELSSIQNGIPRMVVLQDHRTQGPYRNLLSGKDDLSVLSNY